LIGLVLTAIGVALTIWALGYARAADRRAEQRDVRSGEQASAIGRRVTDIARALGIEGAPAEGVALDASVERRWALGVADINNDGHEELLVASPWGPHSSMLHVFGQRNEWPDSFGKLAELSSGTPSGFTIGDLDGDGQVEVATVQPHDDQPYASGVRDEVLYRWNGEEFVDVDSEPLPRPGHAGFDDPDRHARWHHGLAALVVRK
jgi:hypothetical protein